MNGSDAARNAALEARAARQARRGRIASLFLDLGFDPGFMRHNLSRPGLAEVMEDLRREEAAYRRRRALAQLGQADTA